MASAAVAGSGSPVTVPVRPGLRVVIRREVGDGSARTDAGEGVWVVQSVDANTQLAYLNSPTTARTRIAFVDEVAPIAPVGDAASAASAAPEPAGVAPSDATTLPSDWLVYDPHLGVVPAGVRERWEAGPPVGSPAASIALAAAGQAAPRPLPPVRTPPALASPVGVADTGGANATSTVAAVAPDANSVVAVDGTGGGTGDGAVAASIDPLQQRFASVAAPATVAVSTAVLDVEVEVVPAELVPGAPAGSSAVESPLGAERGAAAVDVSLAPSAAPVSSSPAPVSSSTALPAASASSLAAPSAPLVVPASRAVGGVDVAMLGAGGAAAGEAGAASPGAVSEASCATASGSPAPGSDDAAPAASVASPDVNGTSGAGATAGAGAAAARAQRTKSALARGAKKNRQRKVGFSNVEVHLFQRTLGGGGVPHDGGWTLGLGSPIVRSPSPDHTVSADDGVKAADGAAASGQASPVPMGTGAASTLARDAAGHDTLSPLLGVASAPGAALARFSPSPRPLEQDSRAPPPLALPPQRPRSASMDHTRVARVNGDRGDAGTDGSHGRGGGGKGRRGNRRRRSGSTSGSHGRRGGNHDMPSPPRSLRRSRSRSDASHGSHRSVQEPLVVVASIEEYEAAKEQRLWQRYVALSPEDQLRCTLETRQFTYRQGESNPLFGPLDEDGRRALLQRDLVGEMEVRPRLTSSGVPVREVDLIAANNHESNEVGAMRSTRARVGCSCTKGVSAWKLPVRKLMEELRLRGMLPADAAQRTKKHMASLLRDVLLKEGRCSGAGTDTCECARDGVPCHESVCGCCCKRPTKCGNPAGVYEYDGEGTRAYVQRMIVASGGVSSSEGEDGSEAKAGGGSASDGGASPSVRAQRAKGKKLYRAAKTSEAPTTTADGDDGDDTARNVEAEDATATAGSNGHNKRPRNGTTPASSVAPTASAGSVAAVVSEDVRVEVMPVACSDNLKAANGSAVGVNGGVTVTANLKGASSDVSGPGRRSKPKNKRGRPRRSRRIMTRSRTAGAGAAAAT